MNRPIDTIYHFVTILVKAFKLFNERRVTILASSSCFYLILAFIPFILLVGKFIGSLIGDEALIRSLLFDLGHHLFPQTDQRIFIQLQTFIEGFLLADKKLTFINLFLFLFSSVSFLNNIWNGLYLLSGDQSFKSPWNIVKGVALLGITSLLFILCFSLQPLFNLCLQILQFNSVIDFIQGQFDSLRPFIIFLQNLSLSQNFLFKSSWPFFILFFVYFQFLYRWLFSWKISWVHGFGASGVFITLILLARGLFWIYLDIAEKSLLGHYGNSYFFIISLIWVFLVMSFFFFGACFCLESTPSFPKTE